MRRETPLKPRGICDDLALMQLRAVHASGSRRPLRASHDAPVAGHARDAATTPHEAPLAQRTSGAATTGSRTRRRLALFVVVLSTAIGAATPSPGYAQATKDGMAPPSIAEADATATGSRCSHRQTAGTNCQEGNNRRVTGTGKKVYGDRWPRLTGLLWIEETRKGRLFEGTDDNDELLGFGGNDRLYGYGGDDIIWGNFHPKINPTTQRDVIDGGAGDDWLYTSHGHNTMLGGPGNDFIYAYYGRGTIDCGPGRSDTAKIRLGTGQYKVKNCERILNFCAFGSINGKRCAKPGERKVRARR